MRVTSDEGRTSADPGKPGRRRLDRRWLVLALACGAGTAMGLGGFVFRYAEGLSYFGTEPAACANCHIMQSQYDGWQKASHHTAAVCVDCHLPHSFVAKYLVKAENGYRHGKLFTTGGFTEPIVVQEHGRTVLEANCRRCHAPLVAEISPHPVGTKGEISCVRCHAGVGHGETARLGGPLTQREVEVGHE